MVKEQSCTLGDEPSHEIQSKRNRTEDKDQSLETTEPSDRTKEAILSLLDHRGPIPIDKIVVAVDSHPLEVEQYCNELHRSGHICSRSCGVYDVPRGEMR